MPSEEYIKKYSGKTSTRSSSQIQQLNLIIQKHTVPDDLMAAPAPVPIMIRDHDLLELHSQRVWEFIKHGC